jgi:hypothetical protein
VRENLICDITDGPAARKHKIAMRENLMSLKVNLLMLKMSRKLVYFFRCITTEANYSSVGPLLLNHFCFGAGKIVRRVEGRECVYSLKPCDENNSQSIKEFLDSDEKPIMYHDIPYNLWLFKERLYFHHANYRPYIKYKRVTDEEYRTDAAQSIVTGQQVNGVKGLWPFAGLSHTSKIDEMVSYDGFHVFCGIASYTLATLVGDRTISQATRKYCRNTNSHPELWPAYTTKGGSNTKGEECAWVLGSRKGALQQAIDRHLTTLY